MIQELLGGNSAPSSFLGERKISIPFSSPPPTTYPSTAPILTTTTTTTSIASTALANSPSGVGGTNTTSETANASQQSLRCPRCDSTNTKFCYYNNYNLTQPRHFCKTCRRYWTKGGTLRNVPIGGGCRKNKTATITGSPTAGSGLVKSSSNAMAKAKATLSTELLVNGNPGFLGSGLLDHHPDLQSACSNPILWPSLQPNSHILSLLRESNHFHNPNPNPNTNQLSSGFKTEGANTTTTNLGLDSYGNGAPSLLGSFQRSNQQVNGFSSGGIPEYIPSNRNTNNNNSNILELYQRLKSSSNNYFGNENQGAVILGNMVGSASPMHSTILDSAPVGGGGGDHNYGGYGFITSPSMSSWSDYPIAPINGAYP